MVANKNFLQPLSTSQVSIRCRFVTFVFLLYQSKNNSFTP